MNKKVLSILILLAFVAVKFSLAQNEPPKIVGWLNDDYYLENRLNDEGIMQTLKVKASNGKSRVYHEKLLTEKINEMLPNGFRVRMINPLEDHEVLVFNNNNDVFIFSTENQEMTQLTDDPAEEKNPTKNSDGSKVAFTRDNDLYVVDVATGKEKRLTNDGSELIKNGYSSWVYWEEIHGRSTNFKTFWWSLDGKMIAFERFDDNPVPEFMVYNPDGVRGEWEKARYPKVGDPNPGVKLGVLHLETGEITWIDNNDNEDVYIAFPMWAADSKYLFYQKLNRDQNHMKIIKADPFNGEKNLVYEEKQDTWIDFFEDLYIMEDGSGFIVRSDKDGWRNLYYYDNDGNLKKQLTDFDFRVRSLEKVDEENDVVYFMATGDTSVNNHLYKINLEGTGLEKITSKSGKHETMVSEEGSYVIDKWSALHIPQSTQLLNDEGDILRQLGGYDSPDPKEKELCKIEFFTIPTEDGFNLPAYWKLPSDFDADKKYGVLFTVYGGPNYRAIENEYINPNPNFITENGIIQFVVDHRGSGQFGKEGLDYMHQNLGKWDLDDYISAVKWLKEKDFIDTTKIGITGGSYGGYMAALALTRGADYFTAGVSSFPVTDFRLYDNIYTERYMDTYEQNPDGYDYGSAMNHADQLKGKLYIIHGTMDDNVHMQNTLQLIDKLQELNKNFDLMIYPKGRHGWGPPKWYHYMRETREFIIEHLGQE